MKISPRTIAAPALLLLAACGADPGSESGPTLETEEAPASEEIDLVASAPQGGELVQVDRMEALEGSELGSLPGDRLLAEVGSPTHSVRFWQTASGRITVVEQGSIDAGEGPRLKGFRAGQDSYAAAYVSLAGDDADPAAVEALAAADAVRAEARAARGVEPERADATPVLQSSLLTTEGLALKGVPEDTTWMANLCTSRVRGFTGEDQSLCYTATITPAAVYWKVTLNVDEHETANVALANFDFSQNATLRVTGVDCGFLELGLCDTLVPRSLTIPVRWWNYIYNESDDGFYTTAQGRSFGLHYVFWE